VQAAAHVDAPRRLRRAALALACGVASALAFAGMASAQQALRGGFEPSPLSSSPLAQSPLDQAAELLRRKRLAAQSATNYTPGTQSEAEALAEAEESALERLYGEDAANGAASLATGEPGAGAGAMAGTGGAAFSRSPGSGTRLAGERQPGDDLAPAQTGTAATAQPGRTTATTNAAARSEDPAEEADGAVALRPGVDPQTTGDLVVRTGQKAGMLRAQPAQNVEAVQSRDLTEEENPFRAVGVRAGSITLRPSLDQGIEYTNNSGAAGNGPQASSVTTLRIDAESDWRDGSLEATGFLTWREPLSGGGEAEPEAGGSFTLRKPIYKDWELLFGGGYGLKRESATGAAIFPTTIATRPLAQTLRGAIGISRTAGVLQPSLRLDVERQTFGDAIDTLGVPVSQSDRDQTSLRGTFRLGWEASPALTPFVEVAYGASLRDQEVDSLGFRRSSRDLRASVGAEFNLSEKWTGEASVGWLGTSFEDAALEDIEGLALAASINWSPWRGTIVTGSLTTGVEASTSGGQSGSLVHAATLGVTHQLSSRLTTNATLGASLRDFSGGGGSDTELSAELGGTWWFNRMLGVNGSVRHEEVLSSDPLRESGTTTLRLALRLQR
jgi:hypothetical protein